MDIVNESVAEVDVVPMLAVRGVTVYPGMLMSFDLDKAAAVRALDASLKGDQIVFLLSYRDNTESDTDEFYKIGTLCRVKQVLRVKGDDSSAKLMVEGVCRAFFIKLISRRPYFKAQIERVEPVEDKRTAVRSEALIRQCYNLFVEYAEITGMDDSKNLFLNILDSESAGYIADYIAQNIFLRFPQKQEVLEELRPLRRIGLINRILRREIDILRVEHSLHMSTAENIARQQRDMFLREQLRAIRAELGEDEDLPEDGEGFKEAVLRAGLSEEVTKKLLKECERLARQPYGSPETAGLRNYLEICLELPWNHSSKDVLDVQRVSKALNADHYGLDKVKERVLEYLAVRQLTPDAKSGILCLVGPPGTGKTSVAQSIARAMNRKLVRISLGGVHDEAEIRGHRKTYVGAMPGRIMAGIQQAKTNNPVMVLDEIDKLGSDYRGDPSAALLEALDPEQNAGFRDHFLELPFDLSKVFFITTANTTSTIPPALLDRMELIELPGYTDEEKLHIAKAHLLPRQRKLHGLKANQLRVRDAALRAMIADYTREAGVRLLEKEIATLCRKTASRIVAGEAPEIITPDNLETYLGPVKYKAETRCTGTACGLVHGLAWTGAGGELLDAEAGVMPGTGKLELTGNLGDVMQESCKAALSYIRAHASEWKIDSKFYKNTDIHVHFPEGAVPKDGPSAGVTICTALISALTGRQVDQTLAMTGEISLRGRVLPIGGLREKTMAALRAGVKTVIIPALNEPDLAEIDPLVREKLTFHTAETVEDVLRYALVD